MQLSLVVSLVPFNISMMVVYHTELSIPSLLDYITCNLSSFSPILSYLLQVYMCFCNSLFVPLGECSAWVPFAPFLLGVLKFFCLSIFCTYSLCPIKFLTGFSNVYFLLILIFSCKKTLFNF